MENNTINPLLPEGVPDQPTIFDDPFIDLNEASKGIRFLNYIIDYVAVLIIHFSIVYLLLITGRNNVLIAVIGSIYSKYLFAFVIYFFYYLIWEASTKRSLGKIITGTKVVMDDGNKPTFKAVFMRTLCRLIPFEIFSFLGSEGWHDRFSYTKVVKTGQEIKPQEF